MRITFVVPGLNLTGGLRVVATYAGGLRARGHRVTVVFGTPSRPRLRSRVRAALRGHWLRGHRENDAFFAGLELDLRRIPRGGSIDAPGLVPDADVIVATWWETAEWIAPLPARAGAKVYFVQGLETHPGQPFERVAATYRLPLAKIAVAAWLAERMRADYGDRAVEVVTNGVDARRFDAPPRGRGSRPAVGFVYNQAPFKGMDTVRAAVERARDAMPDLRVVSFGAVRPRPHLPLPRDTEFHLGPEQQAIPGLYASVDAWLFASRREGFGLPLLEAMACRTPVVAVPTGAAPDLVTPACGRLVPIDDADAMAQAIVEVCSLPDRRWRAMSAASRDVAEQHTWERAIAEFEAALRRVRGVRSHRVEIDASRAGGGGSVAGG